MRSYQYIKGRLLSVYCHQYNVVFFFISFETVHLGTQHIYRSVSVLSEKWWSLTRLLISKSIKKRLLKVSVLVSELTII